jgi:hypothetical protein
MKHGSLFDVDAWVDRQFKPAPKPSTPVVDMTRTFAPKSNGEEPREEKVPEKPDPFPTVDHRGCSPAVRDIIRIVSEVSGQSMAAMLGPRRFGQHVAARQVAIWLARNFTDRSLPAIGSEFGRDHTTILHAVRKIEKAVVEANLEPEQHTVAGWARVLLAHERARLRQQAREYAERQRARQGEKYARQKLRRKAEKVAAK